MPGDVEVLEVLRSGPTCSAFRVLRDGEEVGVVVQALDHRHRGAALVGGLELRVEGFSVDLREPHGHAREAPHLGDALRGDAGSVDGFGCAAVAQALDQHAMTFRERERQIPLGRRSGRSGHLHDGVGSGLLCEGARHRLPVRWK